MKSTLHRPRAKHLARLAPLALAAATLATVWPHDVSAADRYWTFIGGCRTADWFRVVDGPNSQGQNTCWATTLGGSSGVPAPLASDDAYIVLPGAISTTLVNFADASRSGLTGTARTLTMYGSTTAAAGLTVDRMTLSLTTLNVGSVAGRRALMQQGGGTVGVTGTSTLLNSEYRLGGGSFSSGTLAITSESFGSRFALSGGTLNATFVNLYNAVGAEALYEQTGGTANIASLALGSLANGGIAKARVGGSGTFLRNSGNTLVGFQSSGDMAVTSGAWANSANTVIGSAIGVDGVLSLDGAGTVWTNSGGTAAGQLGTGRLLVSGGAIYRTATLETNGAPALFGGALGAAVEVSGLGSRVEVSGALTAGEMARSRILVRDQGVLTAASASLGSDKHYRGNADVTNGAGFQVTGALTVADEGVAVLRASGGAQVSSGSATVSRAATARGVVELSGSGTQWTVARDLTIAAGAAALVQLSDGARLDSGATGFGQGSGAAGELYVTGNGTRWTANQGFGVGVLASGVVGVTAGGRVESAGQVQAGLGGTGYGVLSFDGAGTRWDHSGETRLAVAGSSLLEVKNGAFAQLNGAVALGIQSRSAATVDVSGAGSSLHSTGALGIGSLGSGVVTFAQGASGRASSLLMGEFTGSTSDLEVSGGSTLQISGAATLASQGYATLRVASAARLDTGNSSLAQAQWATALATVEGPGSIWAVQGGLALGGAGTGILTVRDSGLVQVSGNTSVGSTRSQLVLDGGTLRSGQVAVGANGQLDWRAGTLHVTGVPGAALDGASLPSFLVLTAPRALRVDQTLTLGESSVLLLGGGALTVGTLVFEGGLLAAVDGGQQALAMGSIGEFAGRGQALVRVQGGSGMVNRIRATGDLTLGVATRTDGFDFGGWLDVGSRQVVLLDRDTAALGSLTTLGQGGQLATVNGAWIGAGETLRSNGFASVHGALRNDGLVQADPMNGSGELSLFGPASGSGKFLGNVRFLAGFEPGAGKTAAVDFGGGDVAFGEHAVLALDLSGLGAEGGFDRLLDIGTLDFEGALHLKFDASFRALAGQRLPLLDFQSFMGRLDASHVVVSGLDVGALDLSRLGVDGSLGFVSTVGLPPIPEPAAVWLMLAGVGVVLARRRPALQPR